MKCNNPKVLWLNDTSNLDDVQKKSVVDCGKCLPCLANRRQDWSVRLMMEYKHSTSALFITLTYAYLPYNGELSKRHCQLFMKRLRKTTTAELRYYLVGEYGSRTGRPHYHLLLFNYDGTNKKIQDCWKKGMIHVGVVNESSVMYCLKYMVQFDLMMDKKQKPFALMSRKYGLGGKYLTEEIVAWHRDGAKNYVMLDEKKCRLPRFYKSKIWYGDEKRLLGDKWKWLAVKKHRKVMRKLVLKVGVKNYPRIVAERRNAALSRMKQKVAFTQIF